MDTPYNYETFITGSDPVASTCVVIASGETLAARTPLGMVTSTGKFKAFKPGASDGTQKAVYLTAYAVDASGDRKAQVYKAGTFDPALVNWPENTTDAQKLAAFVGTPISLQSPADI